MDISGNANINNRGKANKMLNTQSTIFFPRVIGKVSPFVSFKTLLQLQSEPLPLENMAKA